MSRESDSSRRSRLKTMSVSVRRLQDALNMHLDIQEKTDFVDVLNEFHITRDMPVFVKHLKQLLDTPAKKQMLPLIGKVIPQSEKELFDQCLKLDGRKFGTMPSKVKRKSKLLKKDELLKAFQIKPKSKLDKVDKKDKESDGSQSIRGKVSVKSLRSQKTATKDPGSEVRRVQIKQPGNPDQGFGFSIRGGSEYGIGVYVSMVDDGGMAQKQGLLPGDLLMEVNDVSFHKISHAEAAKVIRAARKLDISLCRVGRIPGSFVVHQMYRWVNPVGRSVSPPPEVDRLGQTDSVGRKSGFSLLKDIDERKVNVVVDEGHRLGLMIRGGREFGLGIYISGVDQFSTAEEAGLKVGDQILDVNGESFLDITHAEAVRVLKMSKHLIFTIKDVGKLPFGRTKVDRTKWLNHRTPSERQRSESQHSSSTVSQTNGKSAFSKGIGSQLMYNSALSTKWDMIENQARELLNNTEQGTLRYYLSEYQKGYITVDGLLLASFELLNTKAKMTLLDEIRSLVQAHDLDKFDLLRERRELRQKQGFLPESFSSLSLDSLTDRHTHAHPRSERSVKTSRSEPPLRSQSARDQIGRRRKFQTESDLDPLRQAIEQIEDDPDWMPDSSTQEDYNKHRLLSSRLRSVSNEHLPTYHHHPPSLSSHRSLSVEALTPLTIDTSYNDQALGLRRSKRSRSRQPELKIATGTKVNRDTSPRPRANSNPSRRQRLPVPDSVAHRQRSASISSSLQRRHKSVDDLRQPKPRRTPIPSRRSSDDDIKTHLSSDSVTRLKQAYQSSLPRQHRNENIVYAEVHQQPRPQVPKDSPSDDSGVELNSHYDTHQMDR